MSPRYRFDLATQQDDAALRAVLRSTAMPGAISLSLQREPSFFTAEQAGNLESQVIVVRDTDDGKVVGLGCRSLRMMFIDGKASVVGYLSGLRGLPEVRGGTLLARGYRFLKELHADGKTPYYVTTIFDDNRQARDLLNSRRAGLPVYRPLGTLHTYLLPLYGWRNWSANPPSPPFEKGGWGDLGVPVDLLDEAVECLNTFNQEHQYPPRYSVEDFQDGSQLLPGFSPESLYAYRDGEAVTATLGIWDQSSFKQSVVTDYSWRYRLARPFCAVGAPLGLTLRLPRPGQVFPYLYAAFLSYRPGCETHLETLLRFALKQWSRKGYAYLLAGAHERSPLGQLLQQYAVSRLSSTVYLVYWEELLDRFLPSFERVPHLEIATL